jgi:glycosyltransferase involved in cell wall biosynthesis
VAPAASLLKLTRFADYAMAPEMVNASEERASAATRWPVPRVTFIAYLPDHTKGGQRNLLQLVHGLHPEHLRAHVVVPREGSVAEAMRKHGVPVDCIDVELPRRQRKTRALRSILALRAGLSRRGTEVLVVDGPDHVIPATMASLATGISVLWHVQMNMETVHDRDNVQLADLLVLCSPSITERFAGLPVHATSKVIVNCVDCQRFAPEGPRPSPESLGLAPEARMILYVGELGTHKGTQDAIAAMSLVKRREPDAVLCIAGSGTAEVENQLKRQVAKLDLEREVRWLGYRRDTPELLRAADLFLLPSHTEGMSLALLEAMASAAPIVASDIRGNRVLIDETTGLLYPIGEPLPLAERLLQLLDNPPLARRLGKAARQQVLANHQPEAFLRRFAEVIRGTRALVPPRRPSRPRRASLPQVLRLARALWHS